MLDTLLALAFGYIRLSGLTNKRLQGLQSLAIFHLFLLLLHVFSVETNPYRFNLLH